MCRWTATCRWLAPGLALTLLACPRPEGRQPTAGRGFSRLEPFRVRLDSPTVAAGGPVQVIIADLDGDNQLDSLCLFERPRPGAGKDSGTIPVRRVRVTVVAHSGPDRVVYQVLDETWALEGRIGMIVSEAHRPPSFAVGVIDTDEKYWYQWNGKGFALKAGVEPGFE